MLCLSRTCCVWFLFGHFHIFWYSELTSTYFVVFYRTFSVFIVHILLYTVIKVFWVFFHFFSKIESKLGIWDVQFEKIKIFPMILGDYSSIYTYWRVFNSIFMYKFWFLTTFFSNSLFFCEKHEFLIFWKFLPVFWLVGTFDHFIIIFELFHVEEEPFCFPKSASWTL